MLASQPTRQVLRGAPSWGTALLLVVAGCGFSSSAVGGGDAGSDACPFELGDFVDPCTAPKPPNGLTGLRDFTITDEVSVDTGNGQIIGTNVITSPPSTTSGGLRILWTRNFTITSSGSLRGYGDFPLVIVATGEIRIDGRIDVSSTALAPGAGANPLVCRDPAIAAGPGETCLQHGGSGGGGGGFGAAGGDGGAGGVGHNCPTNAGRPGGAGGKALGAIPTELRGGCPGADGAASNNAGSSPGAAGRGGGVIALIAAAKVAIGPTGLLYAGGAGGRSGNDRAGGGGGGSGGMIALVAIEVDLAAGSILAANGGGGGGGVEVANGEAGEPGLPVVDDDADGGEPDDPAKAGRGGNGGFLTVVAGTAARMGERGGGGGGGGVGVIRVVQRTGSRAGKTSPAID